MLQLIFGGKTLFLSPFFLYLPNLSILLIVTCKLKLKKNKRTESIKYLPLLQRFLRVSC